MTIGAGPQLGVVRSYDSAAGLGELDGADGATFGFQCIAIADGSREIDPGQAVVFTARRRLGRQEAVAITKLECASV